MDHIDQVRAAQMRLDARTPVPPVETKILPVDRAAKMGCVHRAVENPSVEPKIAAKDEHQARKKELMPRWRLQKR
jgi:hypothetical protein